MKQPIATNMDQSLRLLSSGVNPNSADMCYIYYDESDNQIDYEKFIELYHEKKIECRTEIALKNFNDCTQYSNDILVWSLSALFSLIPLNTNIDYTYATLNVETHPNAPEDCLFSMCYYDFTDEISYYRVEASDLIECCVKLIEIMTKNNHKLNQ